LITALVQTLAFFALAADVYIKNKSYIISVKNPSSEEPEGSMD
jgi:hypothetical protein